MKKTHREHSTKWIKQKTPKFFWTRCDTCSCFYKNEPMWRHPHAYIGGVVNHWYCMGCYPTFDDLYNMIHRISVGER